MTSSINDYSTSDSDTGKLGVHVKVQRWWVITRDKTFRIGVLKPIVASETEKKCK